MRLRLRCAAAYDLGDLQWCMVHVPDHVHNVGELACHLSRVLDLPSRVRSSGGSGGGAAGPPQLLLGGFLVPHCEEVHEVLRDDEVVDVEPADPNLVRLGWAALPALTAPPAKKRPQALANGASPAPDSGKRPRRAGAAGTDVMAIGWQPPEAPAAAAAVASRAGAAGDKKRAAPKAVVLPPESSSDEEDSEEEETKPRARATAPSKPVSGGRGQGGEDAEAAGRAARAAAAATCGKGSGGAANGAALAAGTADEGRGIFVGGLPASVDSGALRKHFEYYGPVEDATVVINQSTGKSKGFGFVEFVNVKSRNKVIADGPQEMAGKTVEVKPRVPKVGKGDDGKGKGKGGKDGGKGGKSKGGKSGAKDGGKSGAKGASNGNRQAEGTLEEEEEEAPPKKAKKEAPRPPAASPSSGDGDEDEIQRQMAALGLPVSFTANQDRGEEEEDEEDEEEDE